MNNLMYLSLLILSYLIGALPFGFLLEKLTTGKDIRDVQSGRTGGTNAMRAAGFGIGLTIVILDILKGASVVWSWPKPPCMTRQGSPLPTSR